MTDCTVLIVDDEPIARSRLTRLLKHLPWVTSVAEAGNAGDAKAQIARTAPDILLLDINMPGGTGFDLLQSLTERPPAVIFVTALDGLALQAFEENAVDYITKPIERGRFLEAMERARRAVEHTSQTERLRDLEEVVKSLRDRLASQTRRKQGFWVKLRSEYRQLAPEDITYVEAERDHVRLHVSGQSFLLSKNLATMERELPAEQFIRIHRSTMVRIDAVERVKLDRFSALILILRDGTELRVGRTYTSAIRSRLSP